MRADDKTVKLKLIQREEVNYVSAFELEQEAGMAVKSLPGQDAIVLCRDDQCVLVQEFRRVDDQLWVDVRAIESALGMVLVIDESSSTVLISMEPSKSGSRADDADLGVGSLAPQLQLARLDGGSITLSELRGKRVLINSWASW